MLPDLTAPKRQNYAEKLNAHLKWAFKTAKEASERGAAQHKRYYDQKYKCMKIEPGDLVLVRVKAFGPDHKIADRWKQTPYKVLSQLHNGPVFKLQPVDREDEGSIQVLHQNMLFPFQTIRTESDSEGEIKSFLSCFVGKDQSADGRIFQLKKKKNEWDSMHMSPLNHSVTIGLQNVVKLSSIEYAMLCDLQS